jgi:hypothetical protein
MPMPPHGWRPPAATASATCRSRAVSDPSAQSADSSAGSPHSGSREVKDMAALLLPEGISGGWRPRCGCHLSGEFLDGSPTADYRDDTGSVSADPRTGPGPWYGSECPSQLIAVTGGFSGLLGVVAVGVAEPQEAVGGRRPMAHDPLSGWAQAARLRTIFRHRSGGTAISISNKARSSGWGARLRFEDEQRR